MTQDVSEGGPVRSLAPPPVPPRPSKEAVAEAMARSKMTFAVPFARRNAPEAPARVRPVNREDNHSQGEEKECRSGGNESPKARPKQRERDGQVVLRAWADRAEIPVSVARLSEDRGRPDRHPAELTLSAAGEVAPAVGEGVSGKKDCDTRGESINAVNSRDGHRATEVPSGSVSAGDEGSSGGGRVAQADPCELADREKSRDEDKFGDPEVCFRKFAGGGAEEVGGMASLRGLPPLPKSLSGVMDLEGVRMMETEMGARSRRSLGVTEEHPRQGHSGAASPSPSAQQQQQDVRLSVSSHRHHQSLSSHPPPLYLSQHQNGQEQPLPPIRGRKQTSLDTQLALLRQEMVGLRQLDLSLLSQLWSLNESIQEFRVLLQEEQEDMGSALSPPSPSPSLSSGDEEDDDGNSEYYQMSRQQQLHYRQKRQRHQQSAPGEGPSGLKASGGKSSSGSKKLNLYHNDSGLTKHFTPSSPSTPSSSTRSSFEFGEV